MQTCFVGGDHRAGVQPSKLRKLEPMAGDAPKDPQVDYLLKKFLLEANQDRSKGYTLEALYKAQTSAAEWQLSHEAKDNTRHDEVKGMISAIAGSVARLDDRVHALEKSADDSGAHVRSKLEAFDSDLELTEHSLQAANRRISDVSKLLEATRREKEAAEKAQEAAEKAQLVAENAELKTKRDAEEAAKKAFRAKILGGIAVGVGMGAIGWVAHVLMTAATAAGH